MDLGVIDMMKINVLLLNTMVYVIVFKTEDQVTSKLAILILVSGFMYGNEIVKKEVERQRERRLPHLCMIVFYLVTCVAFILYVYDEMELYYDFVFMPTGSDLSSFWSLMWAICVTDSLSKIGTVLVKIFVIALPGGILPFHRRGKYYVFIEHSSQLYRSLLPVYPWIFYLMSGYKETDERMLGIFLTGIYAIVKVLNSTGRMQKWLMALDKLLSNVHYGTNPTTEQLETAGTSCPICHENYASPTRLACSHIFCERCVTPWLDTEHSCPMCRAKIVQDFSFRDGSSPRYIQLF